MLSPRVVVCLAVTPDPREDRDMGQLFRRRVYNGLTKFDRGDFRWEFLVPWKEGKLTRPEKAIVCTREGNDSNSGLERLIFSARFGKTSETILKYFLVLSIYLIFIHIFH